MKLIPALDLLDGDVVRLHKGDYHNVSRYSSDPLQSALKLKDWGFQFIHIVDLSGARSGKPVHFSTIKQILSTGLDIQVGGGIRTQADVEAYISLGVKRVILGTQAILNPSFWNQMVKTFHIENLALSLDIKDDAVAVKGWTSSSNLSIYQAVDLMDKDSIRNLIVTDVSRDGTLSGVNIPLYKNLLQKFPGINIIPAGGFTSYPDYSALKNLGIAEVIAGKAIFENEALIKQIQLEESIHDVGKRN